MEEIEFYAFDDEIWCRFNNGKNVRITEHSIEIVDKLFDMICNNYKDAYESLKDLYGNSHPNLPYYKYRVVSRFIRCNFSRLDTTYRDIENYAGNIRMNMEKIECPLRGECKYDGRICMSAFDSRMTEIELKVAKLFFEGKRKEEIAKEVILSPETINNHIRRIYKKLGVHSEAEFVKYVAAHKLF